MFRAHRKLLLAAIVLAVILIAALALRSRGGADGGDEAQTPGETDAPGQATEEAFTALTYSNGSATLSFHLDESGKWVWTDDPEFPLDDTTVRAILALLTDLKPQQTLTDGVDLESRGLDEPFASLTATEADGGTVTVALGSTTTDGRSYYALLNGQESPVYILAGTLYDYMSETIYGMCDLPELPALSEDSIRSVSIQGAVSTLLRPIAAETESGDGVVWAADGADVTDLPGTGAVLESLSRLRLRGCVVYKPSDEAAELCGFEAPRARVSVIYETATGMEEPLSLALGGDSLDGTGCYVRLEGDSTIYRINADAADALLAAAEGGLSAAGGA